MASRPPDPPESIILGEFQGIRNTVSEERLRVGELSSAVNVDIDNVGQLRRRRGYDRMHSARHHSLIEIADRWLVVRDGVLGTLTSGFVFTPLGVVGDDHLSYTAIGSDVYFSSRSASGKIINGQLLPWGETGGAGEWISPVITPTDTLGAISGRTLSAPPMADEIEAYKGRIYMGAGPVIWHTELYLYDKVDKDRNYLFFEHDVTMIRAVGDGLYVGTTAQLLFLQGVISKGMQMTIVRSTPVVRGSAVVAPYADTHPNGRTGQPIPEGEGPMFLTSEGVMLGLDGGTVYNLTQDRVEFPAAERAAALYREDQGANSYVAVADSAGGPRANTRIGDYVDAEIIRASQRRG